MKLLKGQDAENLLDEADPMAQFIAEELIKRFSEKGGKPLDIVERGAIFDDIRESVDAYMYEHIIEELD